MRADAGGEDRQPTPPVVIKEGPTPEQERKAAAAAAASVSASKSRSGAQKGTRAQKHGSSASLGAFLVSTYKYT